MISKEMIELWNAMFPLDRWWRQKHNVAFNSAQHRSTNYIDITFEYLEEKLVNKYIEEQLRYDENEKMRNNGIWIRRNEKDQASLDDELFNKLKLNLSNG